MSVRYFYFCGHEQFGPAKLLEHAIAAERHGFEGITCSDHLQPWWEPGESGNACEYAEQRASDDDQRQAIVIWSDPEAHINAARELQRMGATIVVLANASGADPLGAIEIYGDHVLPALRGQRVGS